MDVNKEDKVITVNVGDKVDKIIEVNNNKEDKKPEENKPPHAKMNYNFLEHDVVYFNGSESFDIDGTIVSYRWGFGDGSTGSGITATHKYKAPGKYRAVLTVSDDGGLNGSCDKNILIKSIREDNKPEVNTDVNNDGAPGVDTDVNIKDIYSFYNYNLLIDKNKEKTEDLKNPADDLNELNEEPTRPEKEIDKFISRLNTLLQKLLKIKNSKTIETLGVSINNTDDLLNIEMLIENHDIIAVIDLDEIIDLNYERDIKNGSEDTPAGKYPEFISDFLNKFRQFAVLYN